MAIISDVIIISIIWFIAIYTLKPDNIKRLINRNSETEGEKRFVLLAYLIILTLIITDFGLMINKESMLFNLLWDVFEIPIVSVVLFVFNLYIIFLGTTKISTNILKLQGGLNESKIRTIAFINSLFVFGISYVLLFIRSVIWSEFSYIYSNDGSINILYDHLFALVLVLVPAMIILFNGVSFVKKEKVDSHYIRISVPVIIFIAFTQMIITKAIVLFEITTEIIKTVREQRGKQKQDVDYDLLFLGSTYIKGERFGKVNTYYLLSFFATVFLLWGIQGSPLPPTNTIYYNGATVSNCFFFGILAFVIVEGLSRKFSDKGHLIRKVFIPIMIALTILPFYTQGSNLGEYANVDRLFSFYHIMSSALSSSKFIMFILIVLFQGAVAYGLHIVTGAATSSKHYVSMLPVIGVIQVTIIIIIYPILITRPAYFLEANKWIIIGGLVGLGGVVTYLVGRLTNHLYSSEKSPWNYHVSEYWKDKKRVYVIAGCIALFTFSLLIIRVGFPISNINTFYSWSSSEVATRLEGYQMDFVFSDYDEIGYGSVATNNNGESKIVYASLDDGTMLWEKDFEVSFDYYKLLNNNKIALIKKENSGFVIMDIITGKIDNNYNIKNYNELEFLNIEVNERAILVTEGLTQFVYDIYLGNIEIETMGNNFYSLVKGNKCAIMKNNVLYLYNNEMWEQQVINEYISDANYIYYDNNSIIAFGDDEMVKLSPNAPYEYEDAISIGFDTIDRTSQEILSKVNDQLIIITDENDIAYAYIIDITSFSYKIVKLEQKIESDRDEQQIEIIDNEGNYILYDQYQYSIYNNETLVARQWYDVLMKDIVFEPLEEAYYYKPLHKGNSVISVESSGNSFAITYD